MDDLRALLAVIDEGSLQGAARAAHMSRTTLRRRLERLEASFGLPLIVWDTAGPRLTPAGETAALRARTLLDEAHAFVAAVQATGNQPEGTVRLIMPVGIHPQVCAALFELASSQFPKIEIDLFFSDDPVRDRDGMDMILHFGEGPATGAYVTTSLVRMPVRAVVSPSYLATVGTPRSVEELLGHRLLTWRTPGGDGRTWPLLSGGEVPVPSALVTANIHMLRQFAALGLGIALVPDSGLPESPDLGGTVVPVLEEVIGSSCALRALVSASAARVPKGRALLDLIRKYAATTSVLFPGEAEEPGTPTVITSE